MTIKSPDIRWEQRFDNYRKAITQVREAVTLSRSRALSKLETQGLIQAFEFTHELAWNLMRDFFRFQGNNAIMGSRDATRESFKAGLISNGEGWMDMIQSRNMTSHTYNEIIANEISGKILNEYFSLFEEFETTMAARIK